MAKITFRLANGMAPASWILPADGIRIDVDGFEREIAYFPGSASYFVDDKVNEKRTRVPVTLMYNENIGDPACEVDVDSNQKVLLEYMQRHPFFKRGMIVKWSEDIKAENELNKFENREKALKLVSEPDPVKLKAIAIAVFGMQAFTWSDQVALAKLKGQAFGDEPELILNKFQEPDYESKYLAALVFGLELVKENEFQTAVIWNDGTGGEIVELAKGENGLLELGKILGANTQQSRVLHQEIGSRVDKINKKGKVNDIPVNDPKVQTPLQIASEKYKEKFDKYPPVNQKNNLEWIEAKLLEA